MGGHSPILARPTARSNAELTAALQSNIFTHKTNHSEEVPLTNGSTPHPTWTTQTATDLYIPSLSPTPLLEERSGYDVTVKLFYLPHSSPADRTQHTRSALNFVKTQLAIQSVDLLILSFPNITFDADDESDMSDTDTTPEDPSELSSILQTWRTLEALHAEGSISKLGLAEFGTQRLTKLLAEARIKPGVDQINVRDCCVVPKPLIVFAKSQGIELLTHNDCTDILPSGTLRELLGPGKGGAGVLASTAEGDDGLKGEVVPLWVVKYTAVVRDRGVVENKGYFAAADLKGS
jgi:glutamate--cysteine ligase regulatory subunit